MRQFDLIANPSVRSRPLYPYLAILQSHLLAASHVTVVAPVVPGNAPSVTLTSVSFEFDGGPFVLLVGELTTIDTRLIGRSLETLRDYEDEIRRALERVFSGF